MCSCICDGDRNCEAFVKGSKTSRLAISRAHAVPIPISVCVLFFFSKGLFHLKVISVCVYTMFLSRWNELPGGLHLVLAVGSDLP